LRSTHTSAASPRAVLTGCADWTRSPNCMLNTKPLGSEERFVHLQRRPRGDAALGTARAARTRKWSCTAPLYHQPVVVSGLGRTPRARVGANGDRGTPRGIARSGKTLDAHFSSRGGPPPPRTSCGKMSIQEGRTRRTRRTRRGTGPTHPPRRRPDACRALRWHAGQAEAQGRAHAARAHSARKSGARGRRQQSPSRACRAPSRPERAQPRYAHNVCVTHLPGWWCLGGSGSDAARRQLGKKLNRQRVTTPGTWRAAARRTRSPATTHARRAALRCTSLLRRSCAAQPRSKGEASDRLLAGKGASAFLLLLLDAG
jgi:hypothetical protein